MNKSESIKELATALAKAQAEIDNAGKNSTNTHFRSKYADLAEVINTTRPVFAKYGLSVAQFPSFSDGVVSVETILLHESGEWMGGTISAPVSKADAQGVGSATTYCRRYSLAALANIAQEDDDAESAVGRSQKKTPAKIGVITPTTGVLESLPAASIETIGNVFRDLMEITDNGNDVSLEALEAAHNCIDVADLATEEKAGLWAKLQGYSRLRNQLKDYAKTLKSA